MVSVSGESPDERPERHRALPPQPVDHHVACSRTLTVGAWMCASDSSAPASARAPARRARRTRRGRARSAPPAAASANRSSSPTARGNRLASPAIRCSSTRGDLLERAVLQQPREQQVARLEQREVLLVLDVALRQQPGGLEVEQRRGDQQERRGLLEVPLPARRLDVGDELVGDLRQRDLGDVELVLGDQAQQQVEGALEVVQAYGERRRAGSSATALAVRRPRASLLMPSAAVARSRCRRRSRRGRPARSRPPRAPAGRGRRASPVRRSVSRACSRSSSSSAVT